LVLGNINENELRQKYGSGHKIASEKLAMANMDKLFKAPVSLTEKIDGVKLSLYHGAPWDTNQYIYPDAERSVLENCDEPDSDFVLLGHTHYSFIFHNRNSTLINPGSVGQSKNMGGLADWVVINTGNGVVEFKSTPYDTHPLEKEIDLLDPDLSFLKTVLKRNRN
jgi:predicted phosphodiesterase